MTKGNIMKTYLMTTCESQKIKTEEDVAKLNPPQINTSNVVYMPNQIKIFRSNSNSPSMYTA